ncbi:MAG: formate dehydrogenase accessory protein FdhE [Dehalococcoidia bacterium]|nr:formate dehydrogenase accessory protein FdhE [Dehalococcoidia bacterium]
MTVQADSQVLERLPQWQEQSPGYIGLHRELLQLKVESSLLPLLEGYISAAAPKLASADSIALQFSDLLPLWTELERLFREASSIICARMPDQSSDDASALMQFAGQPSLIKSTAESWYQNSPMADVAGETNVDRMILSLCFKAAFHPVLVRYAEVLAPLVKQDSWRRNVCPVCGGRPDFAFLDKEAGARWLICSRCDAEWLFARLKCPFCETQDQGALSYSTDDKQLYRLYTCDRCRAYIKAIDLRCTENDVLLPLERILTLDLDRQAIEAGYAQSSAFPGSVE